MRAVSIWGAMLDNPPLHYRMCCLSIMAFSSFDSVMRSIIPPPGRVAALGGHTIGRYTASPDATAHHLHNLHGLSARP
jgi:hypothetical protein